MGIDDVAEIETEGEESDPRIEAGWRLLEAGDVAGARVAAKGLLEAATADAAEDASVRAEALLLSAACAREDGDVASALQTLAEAVKEDPEWCTPELWMAELLATEAEDPDQLSEALRHARRALDLAEEEDDYLSALACKAAIQLALGRPADARKTLKGLPAADVPFDDPRASLDFAELLIEAGDPADARARLETLTAAKPELADGWYLLGAAAELLDDEDAKRSAWVTTRKLDQAGADAPRHSHVGESEHDHDHHHHDHDHDHADEVAAAARLSEEALVAVAEEALAELPDEIRAQLENVPIVVADLPAAADVANGLDPRVLGLFSGTPHAHRGSVLEPAALTEILLFRYNIERAADEDEESLREEVRTTLLHEAGHFFGLDEEQLAGLGLN